MKSLDILTKKNEILATQLCQMVGRLIVEDVEGIGHVLFGYLPERTEEYNTNINC